MNYPKRVLLGITGGIAAYKAPALIRSLRKSGVEVRAILTDAARPLVGTEALRVLSDGPVYSDGTPPIHDIEHIRLSEWADALLVAPATANTIAKFAAGIADNLLTTTALSLRKPILVAPAMNTAMWDHPATRRNVETLMELGYRLLPVGSGPLACGTEGPGRMLDIESITEQTMLVHARRTLVGKRILLAAGPTVEPLDPVRVITNRSSGRMGAALAHAAHAMGAEVTAVSGPSSVPIPNMVRNIQVSSAQDMAKALEQEYPNTDICIMAAAVSDFRPAEYASRKIRRESGGTTIVKLEPNPDIAAMLGKRKENQFLIGFALETEDGHERAAEKMNHKGCDMMVHNTVSSSLDGARSRITLLYRNHPPEPLPRMHKRDCAYSILVRASQRMGLAYG
ncbi:MAG: bifunctional phosphopantothenoylcysteine decarboxylase/phosphopantothenate--cysteine ligase CoaBC [Chitinivibrionales bacterium]|nr:bifunctional phosphopantothenoylcysteine decarboxylase/phosphopantothenate--cysteine ligase CoaBC [Chitinivibrionales bacterium]MBD3357426.1 bifunctional phosphopantothenoylcysteine decarboxylase/phosphopantothenate--cysteine ligase CoaBC [Chitinivibrionales bacterium]